jgi:enterochelin esterase-like enzyme
MMVYTPSEYAIDPTRSFPLVVLLHGYGDDETAWTEVGRAHLIADNLIAAKRIEPVIIAMPFGHPVPISLSQRPSDYFERNNELFERDVMGDLLPFLEQRFAVRKDVTGRSIVGLSMGGGHAVDIGLRNVDMFFAIGAFSAAVPELDQQTLLARYPALSGSEPTANRLKEFWIPIGEEDFLLGRNEAFHSGLKSIGIRHEFTKTSGGHEWQVWREYLPEFLERVAGNSVAK